MSDNTFSPENGDLFFGTGVMSNERLENRFGGGPTVGEPQSTLKTPQPEQNKPEKKETEKNVYEGAERSNPLNPEILQKKVDRIVKKSICDSISRNRKLMSLAMVIINCEDRYAQKEAKIWGKKEDVTCLELLENIREKTDIYSAKSLKKVELCKKCSKKNDLAEFRDHQSRDDRLVDEGHLELFGRAVRMIVEKGWDRRSRIDGKVRQFVPNGAATLSNKKSEGGNWYQSQNKFTPLARIQDVPATGKNRIVSIFDESMSILRPAHKSLYDSITRRKIFVRGNFTKSDVQDIKDSGEGYYVSGDYSNATNEIKRAYVDKVVDVLLEKSEYLGDEEKRALRQFGNVVDSETGIEWRRGQPMGALMSFPIMCIWNAALFEMALAREANRLRIPQKKICKYYQKINGDDIGFREIVKDGLLYYMWRQECQEAGVIVNEKKTNRHPTVIELNSKSFDDGEHIRTINWKCLTLNRDCDDILVIINDCVKSEEARMALSMHYYSSVHHSSNKHLYRLPEKTKESIRSHVMRNPKSPLKRALNSTAKPKRTKQNPIRTYSCRKEEYNLDDSDLGLLNEEKRLAIISARERFKRNIKKENLRADEEVMVEDFLYHVDRFPSKNPTWELRKKMVETYSSHKGKYLSPAIYVYYNRKPEPSLDNPRDHPSVIKKEAIALTKVWRRHQIQDKNGIDPELFKKPEERQERIVMEWEHVLIQKKRDEDLLSYTKKASSGDRLVNPSDVKINEKGFFLHSEQARSHCQSRT